MRALGWLALAALLIALRSGLPAWQEAVAARAEPKVQPSAPQPVLEATASPKASQREAKGGYEVNEALCSPQQIEALRQRERALAQKEEELARREKRLAEAEARAKALAQALQTKLAAIEERLAEEKKLKSKKIKRLAAVYAAMKPEQAARVVARLDLATAVRVFSVMEEKRVGKILAHLSPQLAVRISRALSGEEAR